MRKKKILFIIGTANQTSQMHQISSFLKDDYDCWFTQFYPDNVFERWALRKGFLENSIFSGRSKSKADKYLAEHGLQVDYMAERNNYDMTVFCTDLIVPRKLRRGKKVWVQEGMTDQVTLWAQIVNVSRFIPRYFAMGTALNGASNKCDIYCVGSESYKEHFTQMGTDDKKIATTGIINFDNIQQYENSDFPYRDYVMVATSDIRECFGKDDRIKFLEDCVKIAAGRKMLFKLHPNEIMERAISEIKSVAPKDSLIYIDGNADNMVANCDELITQFSTLSYVGLVLGKKVHSYFDVEKLRNLTPIQNGGVSAKNVADICRGFIEFKGSGKKFLKQHHVSSNKVLS